jgi:hypothetical protein
MVFLIKSRLKIHYNRIYQKHKLYYHNDCVTNISKIAREKMSGLATVTKKTLLI